MPTVRSACRRWPNAPPRQRNRCSTRAPPRRMTRHPTAVWRCATVAPRRCRRSRHPSRRRSSGRASAVEAHTTGPAAPTVARAPATRSIAVRRASRGVGTSGVPGQAHTREDLPPDRMVPVAEARPQDARRDRPRAATQHLVVASPRALEERLRIPVVDHRREARPRPQRRRGPLPHVAQHLLGAVRRGTCRVGPDRGGTQRVAA